MPGFRVIVCHIEETLLEGGVPSVGLGALGFLVQSHGGLIRLVYVTGMPYPSVAELERDGVLPTPDAVCGSCGTNVWFPPWRFPDLGYLCRIDRDWDPEAVLDVVQDFLPSAVRPERFQNAWRIRCLSAGGDEDALSDIRRELAIRGVDAKVLYTSGRYVDIIPAAAGKRSSVEFVLERWNCDPGDVLLCGGPGDVDDLLGDSPFLKVVVGGASVNSPNGLSCPSFSEGAERHNLHWSPLPYACGVLEGAAFHRFFTQ